MSLTILIPCKNEEKIIKNTLVKLEKSNLSKIDYEIIIVDDFSADKTVSILKKLNKTDKIKIINNKSPGLGSVISTGIKFSTKKFICIYMSDQSDSIKDMINYYQIISSNNLDAVFGSRFIKGSKLKDYPLKKLIFNRIFNNLCKILFLNNYNDYTNAFKIYKKKMLLNFFPIISENFNVFLELPLKTISRKYNLKIIPISWVNRKKGKSKFFIKELTSKYFFTLLYCFLEKILLKKKI
jgi:dolichol-phosphate mannosyltransferase